MRDRAAFVEIVSVPDGEAPLWVRERWLGLRLPLALGSSKPIGLRTFGVLSMPRSLFGRLWGLVSGKASKETGYIVLASEAVDVLERTHPEAAAWWRTQAPHLLAPHLCFVFQSSCGRICEEEAG